MRKKNILLGLIGLSVAVSAAAQSSSVVRQPEIEMNLSRALWFGSNNVAGISVTPLSTYSVVDFGYKAESGNFKMAQQGEKESVVGFNTNGATAIGKTYLWGNFDYRNIVENDTKFLTNIFDPERDMPYYVADGVASKFKKQSYDLGVKVAFPQMMDFLTAGCELQYNTNTGAKQRDPRSVTYFLTVKAAPSLVFELSEKSNLGLSFNYEYLYERSTFNRSDTEIDYPVYIMRGLGNYTSDVVSGSVGVGTFFYKGNKIGGGLQYGFNGSNGFSALLDASYSYKVEDAFQTPTKKQTMGSTVQDKWNVSAQLLKENENTMHKLAVNVTERNTDGIEYIQELDSSFEVAEWITLAKHVRSKYSYTAVELNYELYFKEGKGYSWKTGLDVNYSDKYDQYLLPASSLKAENLFANVYVKKNFALCGKSTLLAGLNLGYNGNLEGEYKYSGSYSDSDTVKEMYANDIRYMSSDYAKFGAEVTFSTLVSKATSLFVKANCQYYAPKGDDFSNRVYTGVSLGITF